MTSRYDSALRARVERLLSGNFVPEDFTRLFLTLRERPYGATSIQEIGHFVGHNSRRTLGFATEHARDTFILARFKAWYLNQPIELNSLPANTEAVLKAAFRLLDHHIIKRDTGFRKSLAKGVLRTMIAKLKTNPNGDRQLSYADEKELSLFKCLTSYIVSTSVFDEAQVFNELKVALVKNSLLASHEAPQLESIRPALTLFVIANMHLCEVVIDDTSSAHLTAGTTREGKICVFVQAHVPNRMRPDVKTDWIFEFFSSSLDGKDWCSPDLLARGLLWDAPIELSEVPQLRLLQS